MAEANTAPPSAQRSFLFLGSIILVIASLYFAQKVLIPLALAILLTFILTPLVVGLQRRGLGRTSAVVVVVLFAFAMLGGLGWMVTAQTRGLLNEIPRHENEIKAKITQLKGSGPGPLQRFWQMVNDVADGLPPGESEGTSRQSGSEAKDRPSGTPENPMYTVARSEKTSEYTWFPSVAAPLLETLVSAVLVAMLVVFMLVKREDLRNRFFQLVGHGRLTITTRALDEAGTRISRYLLTQLLVNAGFGFVLGLGLWLIPGRAEGQGVPYAFLWGFLAALLRFVPYIGTWVALAFPLTLAIAVNPGWAPPLIVLGFYMALEILTANVVEPLLFGHSAGVSPVALLIAAAFWAWLWGPIGLVMSTPLTVCLVVLGKYVPNLGFLDVLLGAEANLDADVSYYQRLLARDEDEATELVEQYLQEQPVETVYDDVLLPALVRAKRDRERGGLEPEDAEFIAQVTRRIVDDLISAQQQISRIASGKVEVTAAGVTAAPDRPRTLIFGCPARDEADELALHMLAQLLEPEHLRVEVLSPTVLSSEVVSRVREEKPAVVCVAAVPPGGLAQTRYLCKRLRALDPDLKIVIGRWGQKDNVETTRERLRSAGANEVAISLLETRNQILPFVQVAAAPASNKRPAAEMVGSR